MDKNICSTCCKVTKTSLWSSTKWLVHRLVAFIPPEHMGVHSNPDFFKIFIFKRSSKIKAVAQYLKDLLICFEQAVGTLDQSSLPSSIIVGKSNRRHLHYKEIQEDLQNSLASHDLFVTMFGGERGQRGSQRRKKWRSLAPAFSHGLRERMNLNCAKSLRTQVLACKKGYRL